jgi:hypothetical protein
MGANEVDRRTEHGRQYVDRILEDTQKYAHDLLAENERLRLLVGSLENERLLLEERNGVLQGIERENQALQDLLASIEREKLRLNEQLLALRSDSEQRSREQSRLRAELAAIEERSRQFSQQFLQIERQNSNLANLYVAAYQLHGTLDRDEVLTSIQEILANLVGSEQTAIFELTNDKRRLALLSSNGLDAGRYRSIQVGVGPIGRVAASGEMFLSGPGGTAERAPDEPLLTACIPLRLAGKVTGVIAVFRLLPQKPGLEHLDRELFELLGTHAATALYCAALHGRLAAEGGRATA